MFKSIISKILIFVLPLSALIFINEAKADKNEDMAIFKELRDNVQNYLKSNVLPELKDWKTEFDKAMNSSDLSELNKLRGQASDLRHEKMKKISDAVQSFKNDKQMDHKQMREEMQSINKRFMELAKQLKPYAEKYKSTLTDIGNKAKPKGETWKSDLKNIYENWREKHKTELAAMKEKYGKKGNFENFKKMNIFSDGFKKKIMAAKFMLWDGSDDFLNERYGM